LLILKKKEDSRKMNKILASFGIVLFIATMCSAQTPDAPKEPTRYFVTNEIFMDIAIKETKESKENIKMNRIVIGLFGDVCPMTVTNFLQLSKGFKRENVC
jgi:hypothetical protein